MTLADDLLPVFDVSDELAVVVEADAEATWRALTSADLIEVGRRRPLVGALGALRALPEIVAHLLHGETPPAAPERLTLRDTTKLPTTGGGWMLLGERPGEELALGLVGKFWRPVIQYADVDADHFKAFAEPGWAKTVYALGVTALDAEHTLLRAVMRTVTTDEQARRWFRRYWTLGVGSGAHTLVHGLLDVAREDAESGRSQASASGENAPGRPATGETGAMSEQNPGFSTDRAREIGERIGIDWNRSPFDAEQFRIGLSVELEHGRRDPETNVSDDDELTTGKIARAHLNEFPDYYTRLAKMEAEAEQYWAERDH